MAREQVAPIQEVALRPVASPVDTFVNAPALSGDEGGSLMSLARGLSKLDAGLGAFVEQRKKVTDEEDAIKGAAAFHENNREGFADAVASGKIPAFASKSFVSAYKNAQGTVLGYDMEQRFAAAYDKWDGKNSDDPAALNQFVGGFVKENLGDQQDPEILRGLIPRLNALTSSAQSRYIQDRHKAATESMDSAVSAQANIAAEEARAAGLAGGKGTDYEALWSNILGVREKAVSVGRPTATVDKLLIDAVVAKAIEQRDPKLLGLLDRNVPGTDYAFKDTPYGQAQKASTTNTLDTMGRRAIAEEATRQKEADAKSLEDVTRRSIDSIIADPTAPVPDRLLTEGIKYDGSFKVKVLGWQESVLKRRGTTDPDAMTNLTWRIMKGEGFGVITQAMDAGIITNPEDLKSLYTLQQNYAKNSEKVEGMLKGGSAKTVLGAINMRTQSGRNLGNPFAEEGISDTGLAAQLDFKRALLEWANANPNAGLLEQEEATGKIGATILKNLGQEGDGTGAPTYSGAKAGNPYPSNAPGAAPATASPAPAPAVAPQASLAPTDPLGNVTAPAGPAPPPVPAAAPSKPAPPASPPVDPNKAAAWFGSLQPEQQVSLRADARAAGKNLDLMVEDFYAKGLASGRNMAPVAPPKAPADAGADADLSRQLSEALNTGDGSAAPSEQTLQAVASAFTRALSGSGAVSQDFQLATLKDNPKAARILDFVAGPESKGNYNAYFAHSGSKKDLSKMTLAELSPWMRNRGTESSATGRYQFMHATLFGKDGKPGLVQRLGLSMDTKFTPLLQDELAVQLLKDRGFDKWTAGKMTDQAFALNLAREWASLPNPKTGKSVYAGDGLNKSLVSPASVFAMLGKAAEAASEATAAATPKKSRTKLASKKEDSAEE